MLLTLSTKQGMPRRSLMYAAIALSGSLTAGCIGSSPRTTAAHKIADALPRIVGPAKHYDVSVDGNAFSLSRGRAKSVHIEGDDVQVSPEMTMDHMTIDARDVSFDRKQHRIDHVGNVAFTATLGQRHLDNYIRQMKSSYPGLEVALRWNDMEASVPVSIKSFTTTARLSGTLTPSPSSSTQLEFVGEDASIGIVPIPHKIVELALERLNPTLDLSGLRFPVAVKGASIDRGKIVIRGTADIARLQ